MPAIGNIVINDGASTPVAHTFGPVGIQGITASYADRVGGIAVGFPTVDLSIRPPSANSKARDYLVTAKVRFPVLDVTSPSTMTGIQPAPTVGYTLTAELRCWCPERATLQNRKDLNAFVKNLLANANWTAMMENLEAVY